MAGKKRKAIIEVEFQRTKDTQTNRIMRVRGEQVNASDWILALIKHELESLGFVNVLASYEEVAVNYHHLDASIYALLVEHFGRMVDDAYDALPLDDDDLVRAAADIGKRVRGEV